MCRNAGLKHYMKYGLNVNIIIRTFEIPSNNNPTA